MKTPSDEGGGLPKDAAVHRDPVRRERADFVIFARLDADRWEQLWARRISETRFELCCIPFFAYDVALGDEVEVAPAAGKRYVIRRVVAPSGHLTFRVWLRGASEGEREALVARIRELGCAIEWSSTDLLAIDAPTADLARAVADHLQAEEDRERLTYETGRR